VVPLHHWERSKIGPLLARTCPFLEFLEAHLVQSHQLILLWNILVKLLRMETFALDQQHDEEVSLSPICVAVTQLRLENHKVKLFQLRLTRPVAE